MAGGARSLLAELSQALRLRRAAGRELGIAVLSAFCLAPALPALHRAWAAAEYQAYSHLVPIVSLLLALSRRPALARLPAEPDARGFALLAAAFGVSALGLLAGLPTAIGLAVVAAVAASALAMRGPRALRVLGFPIAYLLFMVPLPRPLVDPAIAWLRQLATQLAVGLLQQLDLPVMHEGNVVVLPQGRLFVAEACSGVHSLVALLPAAVLLGHFRRSRGVRAALVASVLPIALFWNLVRLLSTILAALRSGVSSEGPLHELAGVVTFALGCASLLCVDAVARRQGGRLSRPTRSEP